MKEKHNMIISALYIPFITLLLFLVLITGTIAVNQLNKGTPCGILPVRLVTFCEEDCINYCYKHCILNNTAMICSDMKKCK